MTAPRASLATFASNGGKHKPEQSATLRRDRLLGWRAVVSRQVCLLPKVIRRRDDVNVTLHILVCSRRHRWANFEYPSVIADLQVRAVLYIHPCNLEQEAVTDWTLERLASLYFAAEAELITRSLRDRC